MAAGRLRHLAEDAVEARSAGFMPADGVTSAALKATADVGIDNADQCPKMLTAEAAETFDVVITMRCGDACLGVSGRSPPQLSPSRTLPAERSRPCAHRRRPRARDSRSGRRVVPVRQLSG
ncbi:hypothetical protein [Geodermatophilus tzadiensis]|uniref:arsenate reductase/protein-tyrosine-phosphatase family protein n=1 Tax=Geodermatophilus tzadiensis TaxID=1137988 RepID=UPI001FEAF078|nr:hypothetical protein [Geodermatophilus tzadiensis]